MMAGAQRVWWNNDAAKDRLLPDRGQEGNANEQHECDHRFCSSSQRINCVTRWHGLISSDGKCEQLRSQECDENQRNLLEQMKDARRWTCEAQLPPSSVFSSQPPVDSDQ